MAGRSSSIRGSRIGSGPLGEEARGEAAARQTVTYFCAHDHRSVMTFSVEAVAPETWDCPKCGQPASLDAENPPPAHKVEPYKTHLAYVKERRSDAEAKAILDEALKTLRTRRAAGELVF
ncbi:RNA polymerase-binding protein RbpA [Nocardioides sp. CPCC 205120]|uniref:RNA polymerase-binding protein RbpA n=1 Tax=Nocardioides sp. CPCC 205120 TaxID=3406462 RepID=UPI003B5147A8